MNIHEIATTHSGLLAQGLVGMLLILVASFAGLQKGARAQLLAREMSTVGVVLILCSALLITVNSWKAQQPVTTPKPAVVIPVPVQPTSEVIKA